MLNAPVSFLTMQKKATTKMNYEMLECLKCVTNCSRAQTKLSTNRRNHFSLVFFVQFLCISNPCHSQNHFQYFIQFHRFVVFCLQISVCVCHFRKTINECATSTGLKCDDFDGKCFVLNVFFFILFRNHLW